MTKRVVYTASASISGGVLIDGDDILGDGVNIAGNDFERICEPGGISISRLVYDPRSMENSLSVFRTLVRHKNYEEHHAKPVEVFCNWINRGKRTRPSSPNAQRSGAERSRYCRAPDGARPVCLRGFQAAGGSRSSPVTG